MRIHSLLYHDVIPPGQPQVSGFADAIATRYKLTTANFMRHLEAIARSTSAVAMRVDHLLSTQTSGFTLTFDDGGKSFLSPIALLLEDRNWLGNFFITTNQIGQPGFLTAEEVQDLADRGHAIGSHSCSHPVRMSALPDEMLLSEWRDSRLHLEDLLGQPVTLGSIPGGAYSKRVAAAAAHAGYEILMTSEPTSRIWQVEGCRVLGRYSLINRTSPFQAASLVRGKALSRWSQAILWNSKKLLKRCLGSGFRKVSETIWQSHLHKQTRLDKQPLQNADRP